MSGTADLKILRHLAREMRFNQSGGGHGRAACGGVRDASWQGHERFRFDRLPRAARRCHPENADAGEWKDPQPAGDRPRHRRRQRLARPAGADPALRGEPRTGRPPRDLPQGQAGRPERFSRRLPARPAAARLNRYPDLTGPGNSSLLFPASQ